MLRGRYCCAASILSTPLSIPPPPFTASAVIALSPPASRHSPLSLTSFPATLTENASANSFHCHSYGKRRGRGSNLLANIPVPERNVSNPTCPAFAEFRCERRMALLIPRISPPTSFFSDTFLYARPQHLSFHILPQIGRGGVVSSSPTFPRPPRLSLLSVSSWCADGRIVDILDRADG